jgi:hypothetical protein
MPNVTPQDTSIIEVVHEEHMQLVPSPGSGFFGHCHAWSVYMQRKGTVSNCGDPYMGLGRLPGLM